jgi:hypothetical protein
MALITISGTLLDPNSDLAVGDQIRFTHASTTGETIKGAQSVETIDPSGTYSFDLQYGLIIVEYRDFRKYQFEKLGTVTVNGDSTATSLPELLNAIVVPTAPQLIEFQAILEDAVTAKDEAEAASISAGDSATDSANSATDSANSADLNTLELIARALNTSNSNVIYATDTVSAIVGYIYSASQEIIYSVPSGALGKFIDTVTTDQLTTTEPATYTLLVAPSSAEITTNTAGIATNTAGREKWEQQLYPDHDPAFDYPVGMTTKFSGLNYNRISGTGATADPSASADWVTDSELRLSGRELLYNTDHTISPVNQRTFDGNWSAATIDDYGLDGFLKYDSTRKGQVIEAGEFTPSTVHTLQYLDGTQTLVSTEVTSPASGNWGIGVIFAADRISVREGSVLAKYQFEKADSKLSTCYRHFELYLVFFRAAGSSSCVLDQQFMASKREIPTITRTGDHPGTGTVGPSSSTVHINSITNSSTSDEFAGSYSADSTLHIVDATWSII